MTTVRVFNEGASGTPMVTIHGVGDSYLSWRPVIERLPADRPVVTYTLRGHETDSENPAPPYEIEDFSADLITLIDSLGYEKVIVAGFSLGGLIAQHTTLRHPQRVAALISVGSVANRSTDEKKRVMDRYAEVLRDGPFGVAKISVERWYSPDYLAAHPEAAEMTLSRMSKLDPACYAAAYRVLATNDFADDLHQVQVPVLAIAGQHDVGSPPHMSQFVADRVQDGHVVTVPNVKHQLLQETPETVAKEIEEFVKHRKI